MLFRLTPHPHKRVEQIVNYFVLFFGHASFYPVSARSMLILLRKPAAHKDRILQSEAPNMVCRL
jgi:hypothetical protein